MSGPTPGCREPWPTSSATSPWPSKWTPSRFCFGKPITSTTARRPQRLRLRCPCALGGSQSFYYHPLAMELSSCRQAGAEPRQNEPGVRQQASLAHAPRVNQVNQTSNSNEDKQHHRHAQINNAHLDSPDLPQLVRGKLPFVSCHAATITSRWTQARVFVREKDWRRRVSHCQRSPGRFKMAP